MKTRYELRPIKGPDKLSRNHWNHFEEPSTLDKIAASVVAIILLVLLSGLLLFGALMIRLTILHFNL